MKLSKEDILHIAKLSKLELTEKEVKTFGPQLSDILEYVEKLNEVDTEGVADTSQVTGLENIFKNDEVVPFKKMRELVESAAEYEDNQIRVHNVL